MSSLHSYWQRSACSWLGGQRTSKNIVYIYIYMLYICYIYIMWCQHEYGDEYFAEFSVSAGSVHLSGRSQTLRITASPYRTTSGTWWAHSPCRVFQLTETYILFILTYWWINGWWKMLFNLGSDFPLTFSFYVSVYLKSTVILMRPTMFDRFYRSLFQKHAHLRLWSQVLVLTLKVPPVDWLAPFGGCLRFCC